jgi:pyruvate/2-oxoglutarate dehydrogenase complex dihydrolipoamide acyltransferase (E2) component
VSPAELQGSTFTISSLGALGLDDGIPIISHPEAGHFLSQLRRLVEAPELALLGP